MNMEWLTVAGGWRAALVLDGTDPDNHGDDLGRHSGRLRSVMSCGVS